MIYIIIVLLAMLMITGYIVQGGGPLDLFDLVILVFIGYRYCARLKILQAIISGAKGGDWRERYTPQYGQIEYL